MNRFNGLLVFSGQHEVIIPRRYAIASLIAEGTRLRSRPGDGGKIHVVITAKHATLASQASISCSLIRKPAVGLRSNEKSIAPYDAN
ncbi:MAG TPA: hypothetical protein VJV03_15060 [Pyrinomonadaceae bacterium]|nr:hypothetical protein [Pyrinomonadaceae bacterium]